MQLGIQKAKFFRGSVIMLLSQPGLYHGSRCFLAGPLASIAWPRIRAWRRVVCTKLSTASVPIPPTRLCVLGVYFNVSAQFWMNLQSQYDLEVEREKLGNRLDTEVHSLSVA